MCTLCTLCTGCRVHATARSSVARGRVKLPCGRLPIGIRRLRRPSGRPDDRGRRGDRVGGAGPCDSPDGLRLADAPGDIRVGARLAVRDLLQRAPDFPLKRRGADVDRQIERRRVAAKVPGDRFRPTRSRRFCQARSRRPDTRGEGPAPAPAALSPIFTEHTPFSVAATSTMPTGLVIVE